MTDIPVTTIPTPKRPVFCVGYTSSDAVAGCGLHGIVNDGPTQDALWPTSEDVYALHRRLSRAQLLAAGRLYMLADGVFGCADGSVASLTAVKAIANAFYRREAQFSDTQADRTERLKASVWDGHHSILGWKDKLICHRHNDGKKIFGWHNLSPAQRQAMNCPLCGKRLIGLQTDILALVVHANQLSLVGTGKAVALHFPASPELPVTEYKFQHLPPGVSDLTTEPLHNLPLGVSDLTTEHLHIYELTCNPGDRIMLLNYGLIKLLSYGRIRDDWQAELRRNLFGPAAELTPAVPQLLQNLDSRASRSNDKFVRRLRRDLTLMVFAYPRQRRLQAMREKFQKATVRKEQITRLEAVLMHEHDRQLWHTYLAFVAPDYHNGGQGGGDNTRLTQELRQMVVPVLREEALAETAVNLTQLADKYPGKYVRHTDWQKALLDQDASALSVFNRPSLPVTSQKAYYNLAELAAIVQAMEDVNSLLRLSLRLVPDLTDETVLARCQELLAAVQSTTAVLPSVWEQRQRSAAKLIAAYTAWHKDDWSAIWQALKDLPELAAKDSQTPRRAYVCDFWDRLWQLPPDQLHGDPIHLETLQKAPLGWLPTEKSQTIIHWITAWSSLTCAAAWVYLQTHPDLLEDKATDRYLTWYRDQLMIELERWLLSDSSIDAPAWRQLQQRTGAIEPEAHKLLPDDYSLFILLQTAVSLWQSAEVGNWLEGWLAAHTLARHTLLSSDLQANCRARQDSLANKVYKWVLELLAHPDRAEAEQLEHGYAQLAQQDLLPDIQAILAAILARQQGDASTARREIENALRHIPTLRRDTLRQTAYDFDYLPHNWLRRLLRR